MHETMLIATPNYGDVLTTMHAEDAGTMMYEAWASCVRVAKSRHHHPSESKRRR